MVNHSKANQERFRRKWQNSGAMGTMADAKVEAFVLSAETRDIIAEKLNKITEAGIFTVKTVHSDTPPPITTNSYRYTEHWAESTTKACEENWGFLPERSAIMIRITQNDNQQLYASEDCVKIFDAGDIFYFTKYAAYVNPLRKELVYSGETLGSTLVEKYGLYKFKLFSKFPYRKEAHNQYMKSWEARMDYSFEEASCAW